MARIRNAAWKRLRQRVIDSQDICHICGKDVDKSLKYPDRFSPTVDHIIPVVDGGTNEITNLMLAHYSCNSARQNKNIDDVRYTPYSFNWFGE